MGNNKNRINKRINTRRHVFGKKKLPWRKKQAANRKRNEQACQSSSEINDKVKVPTGSRIVRMENLQSYTNKLTIHASSCEGSITLVNEKKKWLSISHHW